MNKSKEVKIHPSHSFPSTDIPCCVETHQGNSAFPNDETKGTEKSTPKGVAFFTNISTRSAPGSFATFPHREKLKLDILNFDSLPVTFSNTKITLCELGEEPAFEDPKPDECLIFEKPVPIEGSGLSDSFLDNANSIRVVETKPPERIHTQAFEPNSNYSMRRKVELNSKLIKPERFDASLNANASSSLDLELTQFNEFKKDIIEILTNYSDLTNKVKKCRTIIDNPTHYKGISYTSNETPLNKK